ECGTGETHPNGAQLMPDRHGLPSRIAMPASRRAGFMVLRWALAPLRLDSLRGCLYATMAQVADSRETGTAYRLQSSAVMRKAALLYNPESGGSKRRQRELQSAVEILRSGGVEADLLPTDSK